jgi:hypothetical protein
VQDRPVGLRVTRVRTLGFAKVTDGIDSFGSFSITVADSTGAITQLSMPERSLPALPTLGQWRLQNPASGGYGEDATILVRRVSVGNQRLLPEIRTSPRTAAMFRAIEVRGRL